MEKPVYHIEVDEETNKEFCEMINVLHLNPSDFQKVCLAYGVRDFYRSLILKRKKVRR